MAEKGSKTQISEVAFVLHGNEFFRFYNKHKFLCDELAGIKPRIIIEKGRERKLFIDEKNFSFGIKKLDSFIIDNLQYISERGEVKRINEKIIQIETDFLNDTEYIYLISLGKRNVDQERKLQKIYFSYLMRCFRFSTEICKLLQTSLMISTKDINKKIDFREDTGFFDNLSKYRDELSDSLANFTITNCLPTFKHVMAYYFTYELLIDKVEADVIDAVIPEILTDILDTSIFNMIHKLNNDQILNSEDKVIMRTETFKIKNYLSKIYYITNKALSDKRILPKIQKKILRDRSLI